MTLLEQYDRAWRHFDMIAKQRTAGFNHYLIVVGVLLTASAAIKLGPMHGVVLVVLGVINMASPILFWILDRRTCRLLNNLKDSLYAIEEVEGWPDIFKPFHRDAREQDSLINKATTLTGVFWVIFVGHFVLGFALFLYSVGCPMVTSPSEASRSLSTEIPQRPLYIPTEEGPPKQPALHFHYHSHKRSLLKE